MLTGNANAEFGNGNGAIVNMTTKSGTNQFHGNVFEFLENDKLNANSFFNNLSGVHKNPFRQNIYGGTFGGPILRDKLFFFMDYQGTKIRNSGQGTATVVPQSLRNGNLSVFTQPIIDPVTGKQFPGNVIPPDRIVNPVAKALFANTALYPLPNTTGTGPLGYNSDYLGNLASATNNDQADAKLDYRPNDKDSFSGRFTIERYNSGGSQVVIPTNFTSITEAPTTGGVISWTRTLSATAVNEARIGYNRVIVNGTTADVAGKFGKSGNQTIGIPGGQPIAGVSNIAFGDFSIGTSATDTAEVDNVFHYTDTLSKQSGRHGLKMGFNFIRYQENRFYAGNNGLLGNFQYDGTYTGNGYADFLLDLLHSKGRGSQTGKWGHRQWRDGIFFQDDYKVRPNFTLNLGLRWEYTQPVYEVANRQANVNLQTGQEEFAGKDGNSRALYHPYYKQFMPRLGFAWTPGLLSDRMVVRGGYGITSYMEGTGANLRLPLNPPFFFESAVTYGLNSPGSIVNGFTDVLPNNRLSGQVRAWNPDLRPALIQQWNLSLQYEFSGSFSLNTAYVGQKGTHLVDPREYNQALPGVGPVADWAPFNARRPLYGVAPLITNISGTDSSAIMNYDSLQVSARKRYAEGFDFLASYTFSKTLSDNLGYYGSGGVDSMGAYWQNAYNRHGDYGRAFFDATHNFSLSGSYELPYGRGKRFGSGSSRAADLILGGWRANFIVSAHSGFPITIFGRDVSNQATRGAARANQYGDFTYKNQSIYDWFGNSLASICLTPGVSAAGCAYGVAAPGTFGTSGPSTENAPSFANLDLGVGKDFHITERQYLTLRGDFFNGLNHTSFSPPNRSITSGNFGVITGAVSSPRSIQIALKYYF